MDLPTGPLLGIWAHPDDEAYLTAGLMAIARDAGRRVVVATATWGEHGTDDPDRWPPRELARRRQCELVGSLAAIGVTEHRHLGYRDGGCRTTDPTGVDAVGALLDELQPGLVVTFGPDGLTAHADHRAVSAWTTAAWHASGRRSALWYATLTPDYYREWGALSDRVGLWMGKDRPCTPPDRLVYSVACEGLLARRKRRALLAHASQTRRLRELVGHTVFDAWWRREWFVAASPRAEPR
jgi:LmbE family N-acetylglucosaminyl deacetylase